MKVTLIDYTGCGQKSPMAYAGKLLIYVKNTRLEQNAAHFQEFIKAPIDGKEFWGELEAISKTIRSSWEFINYTFQIEGVTRAYTHQQVRTRVGVSFAQQAQRVADMGDFGTLLPESVRERGLSGVWEELMKEIAQTYRIFRQADVPAQDARGVLPTNVLTNIIMQVNLRTLADLVGKRENLRAQGEYADIIKECARLAINVHPFIDDFLHPKRTQTPALDALLAKHLKGRAPASVPEVNDALKELDMLRGIWG